MVYQALLILAELCFFSKLAKNSLFSYLLPRFVPRGCFFTGWTLRRLNDTSAFLVILLTYICLFVLPPVRPLDKLCTQSSLLTRTMYVQRKRLWGPSLNRTPKACIKSAYLLKPSSDVHRIPGDKSRILASATKTAYSTQPFAPTHVDWAQPQFSKETL